MPRLLVTALAAAAVLATPALSGAAAPAPAPQIVDPSGDAVGSQAALDIVSVKFGTTGTTSVVKKGKKKITVYTPTKLVVTETLAAPPSTTQSVRYRIQADIDGCGSFDLFYVNAATGPDGSLFLSCPDGGADPTAGGTLITTTPKIAGNVLTWDFSLKALPTEIKVGSVVSGFKAYTDVADPVLGLFGTGDGASALLNMPVDDPSNAKAVADAASGTAVWKIG
jgi:hypothetical protein